MLFLRIYDILFNRLYNNCGIMKLEEMDYIVKAFSEFDKINTGMHIMPNIIILRFPKFFGFFVFEFDLIYINLKTYDFTRHIFVRMV